MNVSGGNARRRGIGGIFLRITRAGVSKILLGSLVGQGVLLAVSPLLTRLYSPSDFAALAVVTSVSAVLGSIATLSWERAIVIPAEEARATSVIRLGLISLTLVSAILFAIAYSARVPIAHIFSSNVFDTYWWLVPTTVAVMGLYAIVSSWLVRRQRYGSLAARNATLGVSQAVSSVALGSIGLTPLGLVSSVAIGRAAALVGMVRLRRREPRSEPKLGLTETALMYRKFPLVNTWSRLLNSLGLQLPVILIVALFGSVEAGLYALTLRVLASPVGIVADAVSQYFEGTFAKKIRSQQGGLHRLMASTTVRLAAAGALPVIAVLIFGPQLFAWLFGEEWAQAGTFAQILVVAYLAQLVVSPISRALLILERQITQLVWDATRLVAASGAVLITALLGLDFVYCALALATVQVAWYAALLVISLHSARRADIN